MFTEKKSIRPVVAILVSLSLVITPMSVDADETPAPVTSLVGFSLKVDKATYFDPVFLDFDVMLDPASSTVNAALAAITFDPTALRIASTVPDTVIFPIRAAELIDNEGGSYALIAGTPDGYAGQPFALVRIRFEKLTHGLTTLTISDMAAIAAADGTGRNIIEMTEIHTVDLW